MNAGIMLRQQRAEMRTHSDRLSQYTVVEDLVTATSRSGERELIGLKRNDDEIIEVAPSECLAFVATWPLPAFELLGFR